LQRVFEFADHVTWGWAASADEAGPTHTLHERLSDIAIKKGERYSPVDVAILTIKTWNAWSAGESLAVLRVTEADRTSAGFPLVREWRDNRQIAN
jgi:hypothetical protein